MYSLIKLEWKKVKKPVFLAAILATIFIGVMTCTLYKNYSLQVDLEAWEIATEFISMLFPLIVVIPSCWTIYYERKNKFLLYTLPRVSKKKYLLSKWIVVALSSATIMFVSMFIGALIALYIKPEIVPYIGTYDMVTNEPILIQDRHILGNLFVNQPLIYSFLISTWRSLIAIIIATMGFVLSLYIDNIFIILTGSFIYTVLENFILSVLRVPQYRLVTSFDPTIVDEKMITVFSMIAGPMIAILFIGLIVIFNSKIKKNLIYKV